MNYKSSWDYAKAEYHFEFKNTEKEIAKLQKQLKKAGKDKDKNKKKGALSDEDIEDAKRRLKQISAIKKKKTGLQSAFVDIEKILSRMEELEEDEINPYIGGSSKKKWSAILKLHKKTLKELGKGRKSLGKKMLDETKLVNASIASEIAYTVPPKNMACKKLLSEADLILSDIKDRGAKVNRHLTKCEGLSKGLPPEDKKAKSQGIVVNV